MFVLVFFSVLRFIHLLYVGGSLQPVTLSRHLLSQVAPLLLQSPDPLLNSLLIDLTLFGEQILTSTQDTFI